MLREEARAAWGDGAVALLGKEGTGVFGRSCAIASVLFILASPAPGVDLESLGQPDRQNYCLGYVFLDAQAQLQSGAIRQSEFNAIGKGIANQLRATGRNVDRGFRRVDRAIGVILAERPTLTEINRRSMWCRDWLQF